MLLLLHTLLQQELFDRKQQYWCFKSMVWILPESLKCVILEVAHHLNLNCFCNGSWLGNVLLVIVHKDFSLVMSDVWASLSKWRKTFLFIWILDKENEFTVSHDELKSMAGVEHLSMTWMHLYTLYKYLLLPSAIQHLLDYAWKVSWAMHTLCLAQLFIWHTVQLWFQQSWDVV